MVCLVLFFVGGGCFSFQCSGQTLSLREVAVGTQDINLEAETKEENKEEHCVLALFLMVCLACFLATSRIKCLGVALPTELGSCICIINQENVPQASLMGAFSQLRFPLCK